MKNYAILFTIGGMTFLALASDSFAQRGQPGRMPGGQNARGQGLAGQQGQGQAGAQGQQGPGQRQPPTPAMVMQMFDQDGDNQLNVQELGNLMRTIMQRMQRQGPGNQGQGNLGQGNLGQGNFQPGQFAQGQNRQRGPARGGVGAQGLNQNGGGGRGRPPGGGGRRR